MRLALVVAVLAAGVMASAAAASVQLYVTEGNYFAPSTGSLLRINPATHTVTALQPPSQEGVAQGFVAVTASRLFWGGTNGLFTAGLDGSAAQFLVGSFMPMGVAVDEAHGKLYWAEAAQHAIRRANLDGSDVEELVSGVGCCFIASPMGIALDPVGGKIYWANMAANALQRADLDGSDVETVLSVFGSPSGLAIDPVERKLYWTQQSGSVLRADLDGSNVETLVSGLSGIPMSVAIDPVARRMYWTTEEPGSVMAANLDGTGVETVASGLAAVMGIAVAQSNDSTPPALHVPTAVAADATSPSGATVAYSATATDDIDGNVPVQCTPASGSSFPIGVTTVTCTATDSAGNGATAAFTVTVAGASAQLAALFGSVAGAGTGTSLADKVASAQASLAHGDVATTCETLAAFANQVTAQTTKSIDPAIAAAWVQAARRIRSVLACTS